MFPDHDSLIRHYWCRRNEALIRECLKRAFVMRRSMIKHGEKNVYAHEKMGDRA